MRKYKFRGKDIDTGEWVYGFLYIDKFDTYADYYIIDDITNPFNEYPVNQEVNAFLVSPQTVGQYIGRRDVNGVEVYEGDVVKCYDGLTGVSFVGVVSFENCSFVIKSDFTTYYRWMDYVVEVIGDVYKNPEWKDIYNG